MESTAVETKTYSTSYLQKQLNDERTQRKELQNQLTATQGKHKEQLRKEQAERKRLVEENNEMMHQVSNL